MTSKLNFSTRNLNLTSFERKGIELEQAHNKSKFEFKQRTENISFDDFKDLDVSKLVEDNNIELLLSHLRSVGFSNCAKQSVPNGTDEGIVNAFKVSQLLVEYLLYTELKFKRKTNEYKEKLRHKDGLYKELKQLYEHSLQDKNQYKLRVNKNNEIINTFEKLIVQTPAIVAGRAYECQTCHKAFIMEEYLEKHIDTFHPQLAGRVRKTKRSPIKVVDGVITRDETYDNQADYQADNQVYDQADNQAYDQADNQAYDQYDQSDAKRISEKARIAEEKIMADERAKAAARLIDTGVDGKLFYVKPEAPSEYLHDNSYIRLSLSLDLTVGEYVTQAFHYFDLPIVGRSQPKNYWIVLLDSNEQEIILNPLDDVRNTLLASDNIDIFTLRYDTSVNVADMPVKGPEAIDVYISNVLLYDREVLDYYEKGNDIDLDIESVEMEQDEEEESEEEFVSRKQTVLGTSTIKKSTKHERTTPIVIPKYQVEEVKTSIKQTIHETCGDNVSVGSLEKDIMDPEKYQFRDSIDEDIGRIDADLDGM